MRTAFLLASDIDGTVFPAPRGDGPHPAIDRLHRALAVIEGAAVAYVTGRDLELALEAMEVGRLPRPARIVGDVGTSAYRPARGGWERDPVFTERMAEIVGRNHLEEVDALLADHSELEPQPAGRQGPFKRSFYVSPELVSDRRWEEEILAQLSRAGIHARLVLSREPEGRGLVDVLPRSAGKSTAVRLLREQFGVSETETLFAGDSGNDLDALLSGVRAVLVGNAPEDLRETVRRRSRERGLIERIHFARADCAAGVVEALARFGWIRATDAD